MIPTDHTDCIKCGALTEYSDIFNYRFVITAVSGEKCVENSNSLAQVLHLGTASMELAAIALKRVVALGVITLRGGSEAGEARRRYLEGDL